MKSLTTALQRRVNKVGLVITRSDRGRNGMRPSIKTLGGTRSDGSVLFTLLRRAVLTLHELDDTSAECLEHRARKRGKSMNRTALDLLRSARWRVHFSEDGYSGDHALRLWGGLPTTPPETVAECAGRETRTQL